MSDTFSYGIATPDEEPQLRALMARNPIPGMIEVTYCREPNYFLGTGIMGDKVEVGVCRKNDTEVVGIAQRSSRPMYYNGDLQRVGYLSQLRLDSDYWGQGLTREGFRYGKSLHAAGDMRGYITTIIELNAKARAILEKHREPFPFYHDIGRVYTLALIVRPTNSIVPPSDITIAPADDFGEVVSYLNQVGSQRQFFYHYAREDIHTGRLHGFSLNDLFVARRDGRIVGTLGYWNQARFKQTVISDYHPALKAVKPLYDAYLRLRGGKSLPAVGEKLAHSYATLCCIQDDNPHIFRVLLSRVYQRAHQNGDAYLMIGMHQRDPLLSLTQAHPHVSYRSRLYACTWDDNDKGFYYELDKRIPHIEITTL